MTNKLFSSQLKYLLIPIILTLFEELYKIIGLAVYFSNLEGLLLRAGITTKVKRILLKKA